jgi:SAM-dependent methyltransferase
MAGTSDWYAESAHYLTTGFIDWLGWYHERALRELSPDVRTLLDIGCGDARFVYAAAARGIDAIGIDHSDRLVRLGNARYGGTRASVRSIDDLRAEGRRFDAVTLFDVIEHVAEPLGLLSLAASLLRPEGILVVTTPNRLGYPWGTHPLDRPPHHLTRWTPAVLEFALARAGFPRARVILSSGPVGVRSFLMDHLRLGLVSRALRRRSPGLATGAHAEAGPGIRTAVVVKDRLVRALARVLAPFVGRKFRGGSMLAFARRGLPADRAAT